MPARRNTQILNDKMKDDVGLRLTPTTKKEKQRHPKKSLTFCLRTQQKSILSLFFLSSSSYSKEVKKSLPSNINSQNSPPLL
jgi:hypothetical protein